MDNTQILAEKLAEKISRKGISQAEAARQMGVSNATVTNILTGKHDNITGAWNKVQRWLGQEIEAWQVAETANFLKVQQICADAQRYGQSRAISFKPGSGKTFSARYYANNTPNAFYVGAVGDMTKKQLLQALCNSMGLQDSWRLADMLELIIDKLNSLERPLLIIDEFDELDNKALRVFKDLYNRCTGTGFVMIGGLHLQQRIVTGAKKAKQSYQEILSRLGGEFLGLNENNIATIRKICLANGISDEEQIKVIHQNSKGDLRAVKAFVESLKMSA